MFRNYIIDNVYWARTLSIYYLRSWISVTFFSLLIISYWILYLRRVIYYWNRLRRTLLSSFFSLANRLYIFFRQSQYWVSFNEYVPLVRLNLWVLYLRKLENYPIKPYLHRNMSIPSAIYPWDMWLMLSWLYLLKYAHTYYLTFLMLSPKC